MCDVIVHEQICEFIRTELISVIEWDVLEQYIEYWIADPTRIRRDMFPCAATQAAGGDVKLSIPLAAYWSIMILAARIHDDWQDDEGHDRPWFDRRKMPVVSTALIGVAQAALGHIETIAAPDIIFNLGHTLTQVATAQGNPHTVKTADEYLRYLGKLTGIAWASVAWAGARIGTQDGNVHQVIRDVGFHCGMADALADDCSDIQTDLLTGKYTYAVLRGIELDGHHLHGRLRSVLENCHTENETAQVLSLLQNMGVLKDTADLIGQHCIRAQKLMSSLPNSTSNALGRYAQIESFSG